MPKFKDSNMKAKWIDCKDALPSVGEYVWTWDGADMTIRAREQEVFTDSEYGMALPCDPPVLAWCAIEVPDAPEQM